MGNTRFGLMTLGLAALAMMGCEKSLDEHLVGTWRGETVIGLPAGEREKAEGWARGTEISFSSSRATVTIPAESPRRGKYEIKEVDENTLTLAFHRPEGGEDRARFELEGDDHDQLRWHLGEGREVILRKVADE